MKYCSILHRRICVTWVFVLSRGLCAWQFLLHWNSLCLGISSFHIRYSLTFYRMSMKRFCHRCYILLYPFQYLLSVILIFVSVHNPGAYSISFNLVSGCLHFLATQKCFHILSQFISPNALIVYLNFNLY